MQPAIFLQITKDKRFAFNFFLDITLLLLELVAVVSNALTEKCLPLSDNIHRPYKMMPPELLHTSGNGLIMYMLESLRDQMGSGKDRDLIDKQHIQISNLIKRQSERDFPRGSMRNGLIDGTKCQSSERKGNLFQLLCIAHTINGSRVMKRSLSFSDT
jgi:hypothetical protein